MGGILILICTHCSYGFEDDGCPRMCPGCGHFGSIGEATLPGLVDRIREQIAARAKEGFCGVCGAVGKLAKDGTIHAHKRVAPGAGRKYAAGPLRERCPGSRELPSSLL